MQAVDSSPSLAGRQCIHCGYRLDGLHAAGICPECGRLIEDSLQGLLLRFASPEYLREVLSGLSLYLNGILAMVAVMALGFAGNMYSPNNATIGAAITALGLIPSVMMILGFWKFTAPDPGYVGQETPDDARRIARISLVVNAVMTAIGAVFEFLGYAGKPTNLLGGGMPLWVLLIGAILILVGLVTWVAQFFAGLKYTSWMMSRIPDEELVKRCKKYMWLLPLVFVLGLACAGLGPLIALVMYWNHLDKLRKYLQTLDIPAESSPYAAPR